MNPSQVEPLCRYGHGPLFRLSKVNESDVHFGLLMFAPGRYEPGALHGLSAWVCKQCGYTELFDDDVGETVKNMEQKSE